MATAKLKNFDPFTAKQRAAYRLFCLYGENDPLVRERITALLAAFAGEGTPPAVVDIDCDALSREPFLLADEIGSPSLFAERRVFRVTLGAKAAEDAFAKALPALPNADGVLITVDAGTDKRQESTIRLLASDPCSLVVACPADDANDLAAHAQRTLADAGVTLEDASAQELITLTDGDRGLLANELAKLVLMLEPGEILTPAAMRAAVADEAGFLLEDAADRILAGDVRAAVETTDRLAGAGGDAVLLAGATLRKALWAHRNASGQRASNLRRAIARLNDVILTDRSSDRLARSRAELTMIRAAQFLRRGGPGTG